MRDLKILCFSVEPPKFPHTLMLDDALIALLCRVDPFDPNSPIKQLEITCGSPSCHCSYIMNECSIERAVLDLSGLGFSWCILGSKADKAEVFWCQL